MPAPWDAVEHVMKVLKKTGRKKTCSSFVIFLFDFLGGRLCTFSPCIEQVQRTCQRLRTNGFEEINTVECLRRIHEFRYQHRNKIRFTADQNQEIIDTKSIKRGANDDEEEEEIVDTESIKREANDDEEEIATNKKLKNDLETTTSKKKQQPQETESSLTAIGPLVMPGHTGYLTFAYLKQE